MPRLDALAGDGRSRLAITHSAPGSAAGPMGLLGPGQPAAFDLLGDPVGEEAPISFFCPYLRLAQAAGRSDAIGNPDGACRRTLAGSLGAAGLGPQNGQLSGGPLRIPAARLLRLGRYRRASAGKRGWRGHGGAGPAQPLRTGGMPGCCRCGSPVCLRHAIDPRGDRPDHGGRRSPDPGLFGPRWGLGTCLAEERPAKPRRRSMPPWRRICGRSFYGFDCADLTVSGAGLRRLEGAAQRVRAVRIAAPLLASEIDPEVAKNLQATPWCSAWANPPARFPEIDLLGGALLPGSARLQWLGQSCLAA